LNFPTFSFSLTIPGFPGWW